MIRFVPKAEANAKLADTYNSWAQSFGQRCTVLDYAEGFQQFKIVKRWAERSPTAQEIISKVENSGLKANIVCYNGNASTVFDGSGEPYAGAGVIHWDISQRFTTHSGTEIFHHYVALLHEMGHFIQWAENPGFYEGNLLHIHGGMNKAAQDFYMKQAAKQGMSKFRDKRQFKESRMGKGNSRPGGKAWKVRIEMDNLMRHEWPICDEAGLPRREQYTDLQLSDGSKFAV